jgi:hypothetical protein
MNDLLRGELIRLSADNPEVIAAKLFHWNQDTEWFRFLDTDPPRLFSEKKVKEFQEKDLEKVTRMSFISITARWRMMC